MNERMILRSPSPEATRMLAAALAGAASAGDVFLFRGELGAGKTTFIRGFVEGLGHPDSREVASPTFAIQHTYTGGRLTVHHLDLYRLEQPELLATQGILDALEDVDAVVVIEWSERLEDAPARTAATIELLPGAVGREDEREIRIEPGEAGKPDRFRRALRAFGGASR